MKCVKHWSIGRKPNNITSDDWIPKANRVNRLESKTYSAKGCIFSTIFVLSSQRFSILILVLATFLLTLVLPKEIIRLYNVSSYVSLKGPFVRSHDVGLVSYNSTFSRFISLLFLTFFHTVVRSNGFSFLFRWFPRY